MVLHAVTIKIGNDIVINADKLEISIDELKNESSDEFAKNVIEEYEKEKQKATYYQNKAKEEYDKSIDTIDALYKRVQDSDHALDKANKIIANQQKTIKRYNGGDILLQ